MKVPHELSLPQVSMPDTNQFANDLMKASAGSANMQSRVPSNDPDVQACMKALIEVANQSWRIEAALIDSETKEPKSTLSPQEIKKLSTALETICECTKGLGIKVVDRCNEDFHPGLPDQVVTEEPRDGISKERVIRTIRPTIIWNQTMVQRGEIDIAVPIKK
jgi:hypothetical protein